MDIGQVRIPTLSRDGYERRAERITVRVRNVSCEGVGGGSGFAIDRSTCSSPTATLSQARAKTVSRIALAPSTAPNAT